MKWRSERERGRWRKEGAWGLALGSGVLKWEEVEVVVEELKLVLRLISAVVEVKLRLWRWSVRS